MPKLSKQAQENIAWGAGALLLLLLLTRRKQTAPATTQTPDVSILPATPVKETVIIEQPIIKPPIATQPVQQQQQNNQPVNDADLVSSYPTTKDLYKLDVITDYSYQPYMGGEYGNYNQY